jgi:hypothetical protein
MAAAAVTSVAPPEIQYRRSDFGAPRGALVLEFLRELIFRESEAVHSTLLPVGAAAAGRSGPDTAGMSRPHGSSITSTDS